MTFRMPITFRKVVLPLLLAASGVQAQMPQPGMMHAMMHGAGGHPTHDEATMPGLQGLNATPEESAELALMFRNFQTLSRAVELLPDGIRTVTRSSNPAVMDALISHVSGMVARADAGDDPQIFIQSPTLDIFFAHPGAMDSRVEVTDEGVVVTQTSDDPAIVEALHVHAAEVSDMAARGMQAVHERMMGG